MIDTETAGQLFSRFTKWQRGLHSELVTCQWKLNRTKAGTDCMTASLDYENYDPSLRSVAYTAKPYYASPSRKNQFD